MMEEKGKRVGERWGMKNELGRALSMRCYSRTPSSPLLPFGRFYASQFPARHFFVSLIQSNDHGFISKEYMFIGMRPFGEAQSKAMKA